MLKITFFYLLHHSLYSFVMFSFSCCNIGIFLGLSSQPLNYSVTFLPSNIWRFLSPIFFSFLLIQLYYSPSSPVLAMLVMKGFSLASPQNWNPEIRLYIQATKIISFGGGAIFLNSLLCLNFVPFSSGFYMLPYNHQGISLSF